MGKKSGCGSAAERLVRDQEAGGSNPLTPILTFMRIKPAIIFLIFFCPQALLAQNDNFQYLANSQCLTGITGNLTAPSPHTVPRDTFSFGLHRFNIGINYGLDNYWETGVFFNLKEYEHFTSTSIAIHTKYHLIKQRAGEPFDFSAGAYNDSVYFVLGRQFEQLSDTVIESGVDISGSADGKFGYFVSLAKPTKFSYFILDYKSRTAQTNFGWRVLLSPDVKLDLFLINLDRIRNAFDNFIFGLTLVS